MTRIGCEDEDPKRGGSREREPTPGGSGSGDDEQESRAGQGEDLTPKETARRTGAEIAALYENEEDGGS